MAETTAAVAVPPAPEGKAAGNGKKLGLIAGLTFGGALLGGLAAAFVVAPRFMPRTAPPAAHGDAAVPPAAGSAAKGESAGTEKQAGAENADTKLVQLSNIIVNPAGSQGTRFLMTSVAIAVSDDKTQQALKEREVELRDRITTILESETMIQLTSPSARDSLRQKIAAVVGSVAGPKVSFRIFIPQFVIQ